MMSKPTIHRARLPRAGATGPRVSGLSVVALLAIALLAVGCGGPAAEAPPADAPAADDAPSAAAAPNTTASAPPAPPKAEPTPDAPYFHDVTEGSGIDFVHNTGAFGERWLPETVGPGVIVLDADGDDKLDLLFANGTRFEGKPGDKTPQRLYLNQGGLNFREASDAFGLNAVDAYCLGGAAGDIDNDGDQDVVLACVGRDLLLVNEDGRFVERGTASGLDSTGEFGAGAALFDADADGFLDIIVTRYVIWHPDDDLFCSLDGKTKTYCTPVPYDGASPRYYRNQGDGTFVDQTVEAGFEAPTAKALAVALLDLGDDGQVDVAVAGDTQPNLLYRNRGDGTFEEIGAASGMAYSNTGTVRGGMGIDAADYDRSGRPGLIISYFTGEMVGLYRNEGNNFFVDVAPLSDVGRNTLLTLGWGTFFFDYDLDGWLDLFLANGHLDKEAENLQARVTYAQPQQLFRNLGSGELVEVTESAGGDLIQPWVGRGAAFADFDDDGDLDLVFTVNGGPARLMENKGPRYGRWLRVHLEGTRSNRDGVGAVVEVESEGVGQQRWLVRTAGSYLSQSQLDAHFGLRDVERVTRVVVRWPSGVRQTVEDVDVDQRLDLVEPSS